MMRVNVLTSSCTAIVLAVAGCGKGPTSQGHAGEVTIRIDAGPRVEVAQARNGENDRNGNVGRATIESTAGATNEVDSGAVASTPSAVTGAVRPLDYRDLAGLLPDYFGPLKLTSSAGGQGYRLGLMVSYAEGRYQGEQGSVILTITDPGELSAYAETAAAWVNKEINVETDNGYERTGDAIGQRYHEVYEDGLKFAEYSVIVANRFMVQTQGNGIDMATLKRAMVQIDFAALEARKGFGVK